MRTRRFPAALVLALITCIGISQATHAAPQPNAEHVRSVSLVANLELWLLRTFERVEAVFRLEVPPTPAPVGRPGATSSLESDCRSAIDPNGGGCTP
jgi:hypothetical protein